MSARHGGKFGFNQDCGRIISRWLEVIDAPGPTVKVQAIFVQPDEVDLHL